MTQFGMTPTGFVLRKFTDILEGISAAQKAKISTTLDTKSEKSAIGNLNNIAADELSQCWEALQALAGQLDPENAVDYILAAMCALTGVSRLQPQQGVCDGVQCTVEGAVNFAAGSMVAHVVGQPSNLWQNRDPFVQAAAGTFDAVFVSSSPGSQFKAPSGTLTIIAQPLSGWTGVTNPNDAVPGTDLETLEALRLRREQSLSAQGTGPLPALVADIEELPGVLSAKGYENIQDFVSGGLPPHSVMMVVDQGTATDLAVATRLYQKKDAGIDTAGSTSVTITDVNGDPLAVLFQKCVRVPITIDVTVVSAGGYDATAVKEAIVTLASPPGIAKPVVVSKIVAAANSVSGIDDVTAVTVDRGAGPVTTNLTMSAFERAIYDITTITVHT